MGAHLRFRRRLSLSINRAQSIDDIQVYPGLVYLCPTESGGWNLLDLDLPDPAATYGDLESAVHAVHEYVARKERARREA